MLPWCSASRATFLGGVGYVRVVDSEEEVRHCDQIGQRQVERGDAARPLVPGISPNQCFHLTLLSLVNVLGPLDAEHKGAVASRDRPGAGLCT